MKQETLDAAIAILESPEPSKETRLAALETLRPWMRWSSPGNLSVRARLVPLLKYPGNAGILQVLFDNSAFWFRNSKIPKEAKNIPLEMADIEFYRSGLDEYKQGMMLVLGSINVNGYIREAAVDILLTTRQDESTAASLLPRLSDNIPAINQKVHNYLTRRLEGNPDGKLLKEFAFIESLPERARVAPHIYPDIINYLFLKDPDFVPRYIVGERQFIPHVDRIIKKYLTLHPNDITVLDKFKLHKKSFAWSYLLPYLDILSDDYRNKLLHCRARNVRREALIRLQEHPDFNVMATSALTDPWYKIRAFAQSSVNLSRPEIAAIYLDNLQNHKHIIPSLYGLGELGLTEHTHILTPYLDDSSRHHPYGHWISFKILAAAFNALTRLAPDQAYPWALRNLAHRSVEVRCATAAFLKTHANRAEFVDAVRHHLTNPKAEGRQGLEKLLKKIQD